MRVFKNRVLGEIPEPKSADITEEWISLHNDKLHDLQQILFG